MSLSEIFGLITVILATMTLVVVIFLFLKKGQATDVGGIENLIVDRVHELEKSVNNNIFESMLNFSNNVNEQLRKQAESSNQNITDFKVNVNKELAGFQEKIRESLNKDFNALNESVEKRMAEINGKVEERLSKGFKDTNEIFTNIAERVQVIDEAQKKIQILSEEMVGLQNILSNNQARGAFGEYQLNQLLYSVFGENKKLYETQYTFKETNEGPVRADAVIFLPEPKKMIAVDSKFPYYSYKQLFENEGLSKEEETSLISEFGREVKKHITDIAKKYIIPGLTTDYAMMFVPSDGILALLHSRLATVVEYARNKNVTIVSPTTIVPMLSSFFAIVIDYEYNRHTKEIIEQLKKLKNDFRIFGEEWGKLDRTIDTLEKDREKVKKRVANISNKFNDIDSVGLLGETVKTEQENEIDE